MQFAVEANNEERGCKFKDKILVPLTPAEVERIENVFEKEAMEAKDYYTQGQYRHIKDLMSDAADYWTKVRQNQKRRNENR